ncbi:MAG TPA: hypothetical protein VMW94_09780 [Actinomycetes bacterium]|nr:hypothetical protein [Actinomycetes bacterium]
MTYYLNPHKSQYGGSNSAITRSSGCTWTAAANGVNASTGGKQNPSPDDVHDLVLNREETTPATPGWSLYDVDKAMTRMSPPVGFEVRTGKGWLAVEAALDAGLYVVLQGDSDQFPSGCSGAFNGDHAIGVHPRKNAAGQRWMNDGICPTGRWEDEAVLRAYAEKLYAKVRFGVFTTKVPETEDAMTLFIKPDDGPQTGTTKMKGPGHSLILYNGDKTRARPDGEGYRVYKSGTLHDVKGNPIDIDGNQPPKSKARSEVYDVDRPDWGNMAYVLKVDTEQPEWDDPVGNVVPPNELTCKPFIDAAITADRAKATIGVVYQED